MRLQNFTHCRGGNVEQSVVRHHLPCPQHHRGRRNIRRSEKLERRGEADDVQNRIVGAHFMKVNLLELTFVRNRLRLRENEKNCVRKRECIFREKSLFLLCRKDLPDILEVTVRPVVMRCVRSMIRVHFADEKIDFQCVLAGALHRADFGAPARLDRDNARHLLLPQLELSTLAQDIEKRPEQHVARRPGFTVKLKFLHV